MTRNQITILDAVLRLLLYTLVVVCLFNPRWLMRMVEAATEQVPLAGQLALGAGLLYVGMWAAGCAIERATAKGFGSGSSQWWRK